MRAYIESRYTIISDNLFLFFFSGVDEGLT